MPDFNDIMSKSVESTERPPLPPIGTYELVIPKVPEFRDINSPKGSWKALEVGFQAVRMIEGDEDELKAFGAPKSIVGIRRSFMFPTGNSPEDKTGFAQTEASLKDFIVKHLGLDAGMSYKEALTAMVNKRCIGVIGHRQDPNNPENFFVDLKRTAPLEA